MLDDRRSFKVAAHAHFKLDLYTIVRTWLLTLQELSEELPDVPQNFLRKLTRPRLEYLAECIAEAISSETVQVNGHTDWSPLCAPTVRFEVVYDMTAVADSFWGGLALEYDDEHEKPLLGKRVADAFAAVDAALWHRLRTHLLDALDRDFRTYLEIEEF